MQCSCDIERNFIKVLFKLYIIDINLDLAIKLNLYVIFPVYSSLFFVSVLKQYWENTAW